MGSLNAFHTYLTFFLGVFIYESWGGGRRTCSIKHKRNPKYRFEERVYLAVKGGLAGAHA